MRKLLTLILFFLSFSSFAIDSAKLDSLFNKCKALSPELKQKYKSTCLKVLQLKKEQLNKKTEEKQDDKLTEQNNIEDPLFKKIDEKSSTFNIYMNYNSSLGSIKGFDIDIERQLVHFGYGLYFSNQDLISLDNEVQLKGNGYGLSLRYHFYPLNYTKSKKIFNPDIYIKIGQSTYTSNLQGKLPTYIYGESGFESSYPIIQSKSFSIDGYGKVGISTIYHSETNLINLGNSIGIGIKIGF